MLALGMAKGDGQLVDVCARLRFRQNDAGWRGGHDAGQIGLPIGSIERIDADPEFGAGAACPGRFDELAHHFARHGTAGGGDGVLEIENEPVGRRAKRFCKLALTVGWNEKH